MATAHDVPGFDESLDRLRGLCLDLPEALEEIAWVGTRWRVRASTFAHVLPIADGRPPVFAASAGSKGPITVMTFRVAGAEFEALRQAGPPFFTMPWKNQFIAAVLDDRTDWTEISELVTESYCLAAPKRLAALVNRPGE